MPETNLTSKEETSREDLASQCGINEDQKKPLLLNILESYMKGEGSSGAKPKKAGNQGSPSQHPAPGIGAGLDFSDNKLTNKASKEDLIAAKIGAGLATDSDKTPPKGENSK